MRADYLTRHRAHDYRHLIKRWRALARSAGLVMRRFAASPEYPLYCVHTPRLPRDEVIYMSTGIHGDEPAGTEALITWAERNRRVLQRHPFLLVPCINPWGLVNNCRTDSKRRDLNRVFQDESVPEIAALKRLIGDRRYALALTLHEDYDGQGLYIYELKGATPYWGEMLLEAARPYIPADQRKFIETRAAKNGLVRRKLNIKFFEEIGLPEAVYLHLKQCPRVYTIETPSEYALDARIRAHVAVIEKSLELLQRASAASVGR